MKENEFQRFKEEWITAHELSVSNQIPSENAVNKVFELLIIYPFDHIIKALSIHGQRSKFAPTPSDVVELLETKDKRLTGDEAWAISNRPESETVIWTEDMAEAYAVCSDMLANGDKIGARMAFKGAYDRICNIAELQQKLVEWKVAIGHDKTLIEPAITLAVQLGRLKQQNATKYLPSPMDGGTIGRFLTGKTLETDDEKILSELKKLKKVFKNIEKNRLSKENERIAEAKKKRDEFDEKKNAITELTE